MPYTLATNWIFFAIALVLGALFGGWVAKKFCKCDDSAIRAELATSKISNDENKAKVLTLTSELDGAKVKAAAGAADSQKVSGLLSRIAELEAGAGTAVLAGAGAVGTAVGAAVASEAGSGTVDAIAAGETVPAAPAPTAAPGLVAGGDVAAASAILGQPVALNDIIVIDGIGPAIKELFHGSGVTTWEQVAAMPTTKLQELLTAGGPDFASANPATWPEQARLLVAGDWAGFKALVDTLDHGSPKA